MSFEAIKEEIAGWDDEALRKLQALVSTLRQVQDDPDYPQRMARLIDDHDPAHWLTEEQMEQKLGLSPKTIE